MNLVIGGSGFIGSHLVQELISHNERVVVFDRDPYPSNLPLQPERTIQGDILEPSQLEAAMKDAETVYHLAGIPMLWSRDVNTFERINYQGTLNVLKAVESAKVRRIVFTSTESILPPAHSREPVREDVQPRMEEMLGPYCRSKLLAEQAVFRAAAQGMDAVVVCPTLPIGPGDRNLTPPGQMIRDFLSGKIPGYLNCTLNFADVRDMAIWHRMAAIKGKPGQRYILSGYNLTILEFFKHLSRESGRPCPKFRVPYAVALIWSYIEHYYGMLTGRKPRSSVTGVRLCNRAMAFDGSWTWKTLGHLPRPIEESIHDAVKWHLEQIQLCSTTKPYSS